MSEPAAAGVPDQAVEVPPPYRSLCQRTGCSKKATHTIVMCFWAIDQFKAFRGQHNCVRMFPGVVACDVHKFSLSEIGLHTLRVAHGHVRTLFERLGRAEPDLADGLIELKTIDEAMKIWREPPSPLIH